MSQRWMGVLEVNGCPRGRGEDGRRHTQIVELCGRGNFGGIHGRRLTETEDCPKPTVLHRSSGGDQQESECE